MVCRADVVASVVDESGQLFSKLQTQRFTPALNVAAPEVEGNQKVVPIPFLLLKARDTPAAELLVNFP